MVEMWIAYLASATNLALGATLLAMLLCTLTKLWARPVGLVLASIGYGLGSMPLDGPLHKLRCLLPNFHIYQCTFSETSPEGTIGPILLVNALYCLLWVSFLALCGRKISPRHPS